MRKPAPPYQVSSAGNTHAGMLVLGYRGTLQPDAPSRPAETPPQMAALLMPHLQQALAELDHRLPPDQRNFQGEPIPADGLLVALHERLQEILILPLAEHLAVSTAETFPEDHRFYSEYPALPSLLRQAVIDWATATVAFCRRLQRDSSRLAKWLGLATLPPIESLTGTTSDMHPGGHLVLRVLFRGGPCIFYKPRPLSGEWLWHALLESITSADSTLHLPATRVLPGTHPERYGWMESVLPHPSAPCPQSTSSYWHNAGAMTCLASLVGLSDLHLGNIIATPNGPIVTDAECLASPALDNSAVKDKISQGDQLQAISQSLFDTGLLPNHTDQNLPDVSGLFGSAAKAPALQLPRWSQSATGKPILITAPAKLLDHGNSPGTTSPLTVLPHLVNGYRHAAQALLDARSALLAPESSWRRLLVHNHAPRVVLRNTLTYALLLSRSLDPIHLRSPQQRQYALRAMLRQIPPHHLPASILRVELRSLLHLHIPQLVLLPGAGTLATASGTPLVRRFVKAPPALEVITRINDLSPKDIETMHIPALISALLSPPKPA
ncbi:MAG: DUF4135 domain-containing protein [Acidobacteriaceae bacterium]